MYILHVSLHMHVVWIVFVFSHTFQWKQGSFEVTCPLVYCLKCSMHRYIPMGICTYAQYVCYVLM